MPTYTYSTVADGSLVAEVDASGVIPPARLVGATVPVRDAATKATLPSWTTSSGHIQATSTAPRVEIQAIGQAGIVWVPVYSVEWTRLRGKGVRTCIHSKDTPPDMNLVVPEKDLFIDSAGTLWSYSGSGFVALTAATTIGDGTSALPLDPTPAQIAAYPVGTQYVATDTTTGTKYVWTVTQASSKPASISDPVWKEVALEMTSTAENSTLAWRTKYGYIEYNVENDPTTNRGYTAGICGWCSSSGGMLVLIQRYTTAYPGNGMAKWLPQLQQIMNVTTFQDRAPLALSILGSAFVADWQTESALAQFQAAQQAERDRVYWNPAATQAASDQVGPLGQAILYDISINHGPGTDSESFGGIVATAKAASPPPSQGGTESGYLTALINARNAVLQSWGDDQATNGRVYFHRALLSGNPTLNLPISWSCYGDPFSITSWPGPFPVRGAVYTG